LDPESVDIFPQLAGTHPESSNALRLVNDLLARAGNATGPTAAQVRSEGRCVAG